ncbi:MAG: endonuclease MutS2 [Candidatus Marinimicrobia bacterium]|nr:endonuclease MutS2 [Candidatus Neomarinimicrobiota bacterium]
MKPHSQDNLGFEKLLDIISRKAISESGQQLVYQIHPLDDLGQISDRQQKITELRNLIDKDIDIPLAEFDDIRQEVLRCKVENTYFSTDILHAIRMILSQVSAIKKHYQNHKDGMKHLTEIIGRLNSMNSVKSRIAFILNDENEVRDTASPALAEIRKNIARLMSKLESEMDRMLAVAARENWLFEPNPTIRNGRLVLPLKSEAKRKINGVVHGRSTTGNIVYLEPLVAVEINNKLKDLEDDEKEEIRRILVQITDFIRPEFYDLNNNILLLSELDCLRSCAIFSREFDGAPPIISREDREFDLRNARHPLLMQVTDVVPLNFNIRPEIKVVLITGPNAGGKTVAMKTVGLLAKMAMAGLHIPADMESKVPFFDTFHIDIGDFQSIEDNLSTFSSHIAHLVNFLKAMGKTSLILIDELGTGTDPIEGASLGQAILEKFSERGAFTIATTHHSSLKAFADSCDFVSNAAMDFDTDHLSPTYKFRAGMPGSSYALEIARRMGLDKDIIERASNIIGKDQLNLEKLLIEIDREKTELEKKKFELERNKKTLDKLVEDYNTKLKAIRKKEEKIVSQQENKLEELLLETRAKIENTVREIKESNAQKESIKKAKTEIEKLEEQVKKDKEKKQIKKERIAQKQEFHVGQWVELIGFGTLGVVLKLQKNSRKVSVDIEGKTLWVDKVSLKPAEKEPEKEDFNRITHSVKMDMDITYRLDIRGMRYDEAEAEVIKYLDKALLSGLSQVEIIHGKGTGALQTMTQNLLKNYPGVREYFFDSIERGGAGATIVKF